MNKKKIGITFVALVCLAVVVLTIFYMIDLRTVVLKLKYMECQKIDNSI